MENQNTNFEFSDDILLNIEHQQDTQEQESHTIYSSLEEEINTQENDILQEIQNLQNQESSSKKWYVHMVMSQIFFFGKYILTSSFIFMILLWTTNYSAYIEIAKSYINPEALEQTKDGMYASIGSTHIAQAKEETPEIQNIETTISNEQKLEMIKNKNYHSMEKLNHIGADKEVELNIDITPYENRIVIPKIGKNIPLLDVENRTVENVRELENVFMKELENGVVRYPGSAKPGNEGNAFIFGHSSNFPWMPGKYNDVFALLDNVTFGDEVVVYYDQEKYVYKITQKKVIKPGDTTVLKNVDGKKQISVMTCWPVGTTLNRMIIIWELVEEK